MLIASNRTHPGPLVLVAPLLVVVTVALVTVPMPMHRAGAAPTGGGSFLQS
jgi:hypothetical protein